VHVGPLLALGVIASAGTHRSCGPYGYNTTEDPKPMQTHANPCKPMQPVRRVAAYGIGDSGIIVGTPGKPEPVPYSSDDLPAPPPTPTPTSDDLRQEALRASVGNQVPTVHIVCNGTCRACLCLPSPVPASTRMGVPSDLWLRV
jgi:hypothetical protein